jgi:predicted RNA-binding Zn-ribbon protein involved in translation (DUF1610 family)
MVEITAFCPNCHKITQFSWACDSSDSENEPYFFLICTDCGFETEESKLNLPEETDGN